MPRALNQFAARFHFKSQILPRDQHAVLSELLIQTLQLCQTAMILVGGKLLIEDSSGKPRRIDAWVRVLREMMEQQGECAQAPHLLEAYESIGLPENLDVILSLGAYPEDQYKAFVELLQAALLTAENALKIIGGTAHIEYGKREYPIQEFTEKLLSGSIQIVNS